MKTFFLFTFSLFSFFVTQAQEGLTLDSCYTLAREHFPLTRQHDLILQSESYTVENASKGYLPNIAIYGQATYQSDVPRVPIDLPGSPPPLAPKDQYRIYGEIHQTIYDGGNTRLAKNVAQTESLTKQQQLEVELYTLKERINQMFFGILMIDEQQHQLTLRQKDIEIGYKKVQGAVDGGIALKSNLDILRVETLKVNQRRVELTSTRKAYLQMLSQMIGQTLEEDTKLVVPPLVLSDHEINRPELKLYDLQAESLQLKDDQLQTANRPKVQLFAQAGLGRPGLNIFDRDLTGYFQGGLQVAWPLVGYYTTNNHRHLISLEHDQINLKRETFLYHTQLKLTQQEAEIEKLELLLASDDEIVDLQTSIKATTLTQMENGVATANDYLLDVNKEDQARQTKSLHHIQWLMAQYAAKTTSGN